MAFIWVAKSYMSMESGKRFGERVGICRELGKA